MKIVNYKEFVLLPENTIYSRVVGHCIDGLEIKQDTIEPGIDFRYIPLIVEIDCDDGGERYELVEQAKLEGKELALHFNTEYRDGMFNDDGLFAIWNKEEVKRLIDRLSFALLQQD